MPGPARRLVPLGLGGLLALACGGPPPRAPNPTRPLDERRAVEIIRGAFRAEGDRSSLGGKIRLPGGKELEVDVGASGHQYGVAYVTSEERWELGDAIPVPEPGMEDALRLVRGAGEFAGTKVLVLHDTSYLYDDQVGTDHEATVLTAERKLDRDVRDFVVRAHAEKWP
ncbi:MAG: hypothetical protein FJ104_14225 [Deltaproteobacteria bacterium]|nr:hypothetical protein [Deltaproteobacteria bacterium]